ncbi:hypothetical protein BX616_001319 [Lobosporangium transversale]|uniref:Major facilitator superfamily domain-containing protein n=1 Tax=Lobosporangium transversale TaxID=64571 RepID=A0A1Y2G6H8_9FUNG|nr:major facilitator superfamily domain-containing protein [Lobosporangium transversale]KAF9917332.1 hypothetical protein BX616_001319 [Lobosporangium transversale]ORY98272.1 major facilitator superfamily domain-containing protein [Lobosporangium transversale]|eukprot:XP_021875701.1 major facilitator superfamily domain-containing protein [Lobosporangium transversale]
MSNIEESVSETTPLFGNEQSDQNTTTPSLLHKEDRHRLTWYWPWQPTYWAAIPVIFLAGLSAGPSLAMMPPLIKTLFCERGIPKYFPIQDVNNNFTIAGNNYISINTLASLAQTSEDDSRCDSAEYSAAIAKFVGISASLAAIAVTLTVRFWSSLSDRIGRKHTMILWASGYALAQIVPLSVYYNKNLSLYLIWLGGILEGAVGSLFTVHVLSHAYAADVTHPEERTVVFGRLLAGYYAGLGFGAALGGAVVKGFGLIAVFWLMPTIVLLDLLYILLIPESLTITALAKNNNENEDSSSSSAAQLTSSQSRSTVVDVISSDEPFGSSRQSQQQQANKGDDSSRSSTNDSDATTLADPFEQFVKDFFPEQLPRRLGGKYSVIMLMITCFLTLMAVLGCAYQITPYLLYRFRWSNAQLSVVGTIHGLSRLVSLTMLLPLIMRFSPHASTNPAASIYFSLKIVFVGLLIEVLTMVLYGASTIPENFYVGGVTGAIGSLFFPATRGILSQAVAPELLGKTFGTLATFESLSAVVAPSLFAWFYGLTLKTHPSAVFYLSAFGVSLASLLAFLVLLAHRKQMHQCGHA